MKKVINIFLMISVILTAIIVPIQGINMFFRNEAADHLLMIENSSLLDTLGPPISSINFRPITKLFWYYSYQCFHLNATYYIAENIIFYAFSMLLLYAITKKLTDRFCAFIVVLLYQMLFFFTEHCLFNAVYGLFYPMLMTFYLLGIYFFLLINKYRRIFVISGLVSLYAAIFIHSFAIPLSIIFLVTYFSTTNADSNFSKIKVPRWLISNLVAMALLFPIVQSGGNFIANVPNNILQSFVVHNFEALFRIFFTNTQKLIVIFFLTLSCVYQNDPEHWLSVFKRCILSLFTGIISIFLPNLTFLVLLIVLLLYHICCLPNLRWLAGIALLGLLFFLSAPEGVAAYLQPFSYSMCIMFGINIKNIVRTTNYSMIFKPRIKNFLYLVLLPSYSILLIGLHVLGFDEVMFVNKKIDQLRSIEGLQNNFRQVLYYLKKHQKIDYCVYFCKAKEYDLLKIYSVEYVKNMRPTKFNYEPYLALFNINMKTKYLLIDELGEFEDTDRQKGYFVAVNEREISYFDKLGLKDIAEFSSFGRRATIFEEYDNTKYK